MPDQCFLGTKLLVLYICLHWLLCMNRCPIFKRRDLACLLPIEAVCYAVASNTSSWNVFKIATDFPPPGTIDYDFPYLFFSLPPRSQQNIIEYSSSQGINNRLHIDTGICIAAEHRVHRGVICRGSQDEVCMPKHISLSFPLEGCKCKDTETMKSAAYFYNLRSYTLKVEQPSRQDEVLAVKVAVYHWCLHICMCRRLFMTRLSFRVVRGEMVDKLATAV